MHEICITILTQCSNRYENCAMVNIKVILGVTKTVYCYIVRIAKYFQCHYFLFAQIYKCHIQSPELHNTGYCQEFVQ